MRTNETGTRMSHLDQLEKTFFAEGPRALQFLALLFLGLGLLASLVLGFSSSGFVFGYLWFAAVAAVPAVIAALLSRAIAARHIATIPLALMLCAASAWLFLRDPTSAVEGLAPNTPILIGIWAISILEVLAIVAFLAFLIHLWRKGAFS
jgi:hypothetical protein